MRLHVAPEVYAGLMAAAWMAMLGACAGSFLTVVIYRLPRGVSVVGPRSCAPCCGRALRVRDLVPLASYVWRRGRCAYCGVPISAVYPLVEAGTALTFVALWLGDGWTPALGRHLVLALLLIAAAEIDRRHGVIPNRLLAAAAIVGLLMVAGPGAPGVGEAAAAALASAGLVLLLRQGSRWATGEPGMGLGDVKLAATTALFLGWGNLWVFYLAAVLGGTLGLVGLWTGRLQRTSRIPFAPFVAAGAVLHLSWLPASAVLP